MGMTFLFDGKRYEKTLYSITAWSREQVPGALEQMEKLRNSGHLVGYVRREAFEPEYEPDVTMDHSGQPMALLKFHLFRRAVDEAEGEGFKGNERALSATTSMTPSTSMNAPSSPETFCPAIAARPAGASPLLETRCSCGTIYRLLGQNRAFAGLVKDDFEELVFIGEEEPVQVPDEKAPLRELLIQALGSAHVLMGRFESGAALLVREHFALHRMAQDRHHVLLVDRTKEDDILSRLVLPQSPLFAQTRLEGGRALFLREHLEHMALLARGHAIPATRVEELLKRVVSVQLPLPGGHLLFGEEIQCPWGLLPEEIQEQYGISDSKAATILEMTLFKDGSLELASRPLESAGAEIALDVERACLDERTDRHFLHACLPLADGDNDSTADAQAAGGNAVETDRVVVNRFAAVAGLSYGSLIAIVGGQIVCPASEDRARWSTSLAWLLTRGLVFERPLGLPQVLSAEALFRLSSVRGIEKARLVPSAGQ